MAPSCRPRQRRGSSWPGARADQNAGHQLEGIENPTASIQPNLSISLIAARTKATPAHGRHREKAQAHRSIPNQVGVRGGEDGPAYRGKEDEDDRANNSQGTSGSNNAQDTTGDSKKSSKRFNTLLPHSSTSTADQSNLTTSLPAPSPTPCLNRTSLTTSTQSSHSPSSTKLAFPIPICAIIGAAVGAAVLLGAALYLLHYFLGHSRRLEHSKNDRFPWFLAPCVFSSTDKHLENTSTDDLIAPGEPRRNSVAKSGQMSGVTTSITTAQISTDLVSDATVRRENRGRRAVDAGPVSANTDGKDEEEGTLPPDYSDVFSISNASTAPSGGA